MNPYDLSDPNHPARLLAEGRPDPPCEDSRPATCSLMPVQFNGREIMLDVSPMTVDEFRQWAIGELKAHIEWGKQVFPFITANSQEQE